MAKHTVPTPEGGEVEVKTDEPAMIRASVVGVLHTVALVLGFLGYTNAETQVSGATEAIGAAVLGATTLAFHLGLGAWIRAHVFPVTTVVDKTNAGLTAVLGQLGPVLQHLHVATRSTAQALENTANPVAKAILTPGGGGGGGTVTYQESTPLFDGGISDAPDPETEDNISDEDDPEPGGDEPDTPNADEVPPAGVPVTASQIKASQPPSQDAPAPAPA